MGFIFLLEFWSAGYFSESTLAALLWGLLLGSVISPALCQICIFVQHDPKAAAPGAVVAGAKYQLPEDAGGSSSEDKDMDSPLNKTDHSIGKNGMDTKASYLRNSMQYTSPGGSDKEREVPLIYNAVSPMSYPVSPGRDHAFPAPYVPAPQEPSPTQAPGGPAGAAPRGAFYGGSAQSAQIIRPGLQASAQRSAPPPMATQDRSLPPTLESTRNDMAGTQANHSGYQNGSPNLQATSGYASAVTPSNPISAVPINSQNRRTVPSIWADDD